MSRLSYDLSRRLHRLSLDTREVRLEHKGNPIENALHFIHQLLYQRKCEYTKTEMDQAKIRPCLCSEREEKGTMMASCLRCLSHVNKNIATANMAGRVALSFKAGELTPEAIARLWLLANAGFLNTIAYEAVDCQNLKGDWLKELVSTCNAKNVDLQLKCSDAVQICRQLDGFHFLELHIKAQRRPQPGRFDVDESCVYRIPKIQRVRVVVEPDATMSTATSTCLFINSESSESQRLLHFQRAVLSGWFLFIGRFEQLDIEMPYRQESNIESFLASVTRTYGNALPLINVRFTGERKAVSPYSAVPDHTVNALLADTERLTMETGQITGQITGCNLDVCKLRSLRGFDTGGPSMFTEQLSFDNIRNIQEVITTARNPVFIYRAVLPLLWKMSEVVSLLLLWLEARFKRDAAIVNTLVTAMAGPQGSGPYAIITDYAGYTLRDDIALAPIPDFLPVEVFLPALVIPSVPTRQTVQVVDLSNEDKYDEQPSSTASRSDGKQLASDTDTDEDIESKNQITGNTQVETDEPSSSQMEDPDFDPSRPSNIPWEKKHSREAKAKKRKRP
jgi:hypothetical protein